MTTKPTDKFTNLLTRLVRVPKEQIDKKEREYLASRKRGAAAAKPKAIVPTKSKRRNG